MMNKKIAPKKNIVEQIVLLLELQRKALSKTHFYSTLRIEKMLNNRIAELGKKDITKRDLRLLLQSWAKTKALIEEIGSVCHNFFYEEEDENYTQIGKKVQKKRLYQNYSLKA